MQGVGRGIEQSRAVAVAADVASHVFAEHPPPAVLIPEAGVLYVFFEQGLRADPSVRALRPIGHGHAEHQLVPLLNVRVGAAFRAGFVQEKRLVLRREADDRIGHERRVPFVRARLEYWPVRNGLPRPGRVRRRGQTDALIETDDVPVLVAPRHERLALLGRSLRQMRADIEEVVLPVEFEGVGADGETPRPVMFFEHREGLLVLERPLWGPANGSDDIRVRIP